MKNKSFFLCLTLLLLSQTMWAQSGSRISFKESTYDFGTVNEKNGFVEHKFTFTNTGKAPLIIEKVKASCGCTTPAWTKEPVLPGKSGFVQVKFDPRNRPGSFNKTMTITSNAVPNTHRLTIKGTVAKKELTLEEEFRSKKGHLGFKYSILHMGKVKTNKPETKTFAIANLGDKPISFNGNNRIPAHLKIKIKPKTLQPKQKGQMIVVYDGKAKHDFGYQYDYITLGTNDTETPNKSIRITASVEEYFPPMSDSELAQAPKLVLSEKSFDFQDIKEGDKVTHQFTLTNQGKKPLVIRKTKTTCGCTASQLPKKTLGPGESTKMTITFNSRGRSGKQYKTITIISNDPAKPTQRFTLKGTVLAKK